MGAGPRSRGRWTGTALLVLCMGGVGCGDDDATDASPMDGTTVDADGPAEAVTSPAISWWDPGVGAVSPIQLGDCRPGWRRVELDGVSTCDPWPEGGRSSCGTGESHFPGGAGCEPVGEPCPSSTFAAALPTDRPIVYVDADAPAGGDGTSAAPHARLGAALPAPGAVVAVAAGTYDAIVRLDGGTTLYGTCAAQVILAPSTVMAPNAAVTIEVSGEIRNATVRSTGYGITIAAGSEASVRDVVIDAAADVGVAMRGNDLLAERVVVRGVRRGSAPAAVAFFLGSRRATVQEVLIEASDDVGFAVEGDSTILFQSATVVSLDRSLGAMIGGGLRVLGDASVTASSLILEESQGPALLTGGRASVTILGATLRNTAPAGFREEAVGVRVEGDGQLDLLDTLVDGHRHSGANLFGSARLRSVFIHDVTPSEAAGGGGGIVVADGASTTIEGAVLARSGAIAFLLDGEGVDVVASNFLIRDTVTDAAGVFGRSMSVQRGASLELDSSVIEGASELGGFVGDATAVLRDVVISDIQGREDGLSGRGLSVEYGSDASLERVALLRTHDFGLLVMDAGSAVTGTDVSIRDSLARTCASTTCSGEPFGTGVGAYYGAGATFTRFEIVDSDLCGLHVAERGSLDFQDGRVERAQIGACIQVDGYDISRVSSNVAYADNGVNLQNTMLPVPEPNF